MSIIAGPVAALDRDQTTADMITSIRRRIDALRLDLGGLTVATEAATGAYACTAVIAALAGAQVEAVARDSPRYGSFEDARRATMRLADAAGVANRITVARAFGPRSLERCDIVTNSGALRPIDRGMIGRLPPDAVIALMFEAWEFREADLDLAACRARGIRVVAVNERHPDIAVFDFLGPLAARLLADGEVGVAHRKIALLCDNPFAAYLEAGLADRGADVAVFDAAGSLRPAPWDAVVVAIDPTRNPPLGGVDLAAIWARAPGAALAQFWGDVDRAAARRLGFQRIAPAVEPASGHMGILLDALGHEPIVRLQAGGLCAAARIHRGGCDPDDVAVVL